MICPNCLSQMNKIDATNRLRESFFCSRCNRVCECVVIPIKPTVTHSGLEKIEHIRNYSLVDAISKLNEVIEKVNLMMEVMNKEVK